MDVRDSSFPLPGYVICRSSTAGLGGRVFEVAREGDGRLFVARVHRFGDPLQRARVEHELDSLRESNPSGVGALVSVERVGEDLVVISERVAGLDLVEYSGAQPLALGEFLSLALQLVEILARVHARVPVHGDLRATTIFINPTTRYVELADLGLARVLDPNPTHGDSTHVREVLPYVAPEYVRSGRADSRSDLHALGVVFYELLTGRRPFVGASASELTHVLLARRPRPPDELRRGLPQRLTAMVMKLLEKLPEQRYQSALGLHADLVRLTQALAEGIEPHFELAERDYPTSLQMPQRLLGRSTQLFELQRSLAEVRARNEARLVFVTGEAGIGKSAILRALERPPDGRLARGRFVDANSDGPFRGFAEAFGDLIGQLIEDHEGHDRSRQVEWRERLRERLGPLLDVLGDFVPALAGLFGRRQLPLGSPAGFGLAEATNRVQIAVRRFLAALAESGPLVILLDDVQRADPSSLELLRGLASGLAGPVLIVVAATPASEPTRASSIEGHEGHALDAMRRELVAGGQALAIELGPLALPDLEAMLTTMLGRGAAEVRELAELLLDRTGGNPLFVRKYLRELDESGRLALGDEGWAWDLSAIAAAPLPADPLALIRSRLDRLAPELRSLLDRAACIGTHFDLAGLRALTRADDDHEAELARCLHELERREILVRVGEDYRFAHDAIHAQIVRSLDHEQRARNHWQLALRLRELLGRDLGPRLFELAEHVAIGLSAAGPLDADERRELFDLEFAAGEHALRAAAWTSGERYLSAALGLVDAVEHDAIDDERVFAVRFARAQALALCRRRAEADEAFAGLLDADPSLGDFGRVVARRVQILVMEDRPRLALEVGLAALARCGQPVGSGKLALALELRRVRRALRGRELTSFAAMAERVSDERVDAALWILDAIETPAFLLDRPLWTALCVRHVRLILTHGFHSTASVAFVQQAIVFAAMRETNLAAALADHALVLAERGPLQLRARVECRARLFIWPYTRSFTELNLGIEELFVRALDVGDRETAGYGASLGLRALLEAGQPLREVVAFGQRALAELDAWATVDQRVGVLGSLRAAEALLGQTSVGFGPRDAEGAGMVTKIALVNASALADWLLGRRVAAFRELDRIAPAVEQTAFGTWSFARHAVLHAVGAVEEFEREGRPAARARALIRLVQAHWDRLRRQAEVAPINFRAMAELVEAELERARGRHDRALQRYEEARARADDRGQAYLAGIAAERLADLALQMNQPTSAAGALRLARESYLRWGAGAVVERLEQDHGELFGESRASEASISVVGELEWQVDAGAMLATMQAISEELHLDRVIVRVLAAAIEHAAADRGVLLLELEREGQVCIVAEGSSGSISEYLDVPTPMSTAGRRVPKTLIELVLKTGKAVILDEYDQDPALVADPYFDVDRPSSVLCLAIVKHNRPVGALLLEHANPSQEFTFERIELLRSFASQAAAALDNAQLYDKLQRGEAQWRSLVSGVPDIIALIDAQGRVEFVNHLEPFGVDTALVVGNLASAAMAEQSRAAWSKALGAALSGAGAQELEIQIAPRDYAPRWYALRLAPIEVGERVEKVITIATDIEERKQSEADQARLEAQLRQQQRLESLGTLASGVAHEINNPIQGIMNYAELIVRRPDERELVEEFASEISQESQRVAVIVHNLLAFSRQETDLQASETIAVPGLVDRTLSLIRAVLRKDQIELELEFPADLPLLRCRSQQIQQILMNLVTNARDALNERRAAGSARWIRLSARSFAREGVVWIRVSVDDRGGGIDEAVLGRIFDPFFTTKGRDKGTGLGLAVSHGIAVEHGGRLWVENRPGVGATFHLDLPSGSEPA